MDMLNRSNVFFKRVPCLAHKLSYVIKLNVTHFSFSCNLHNLYTFLVCDVYRRLRPRPARTAVRAVGHGRGTCELRLLLTLYTRVPTCTVCIAFGISLHEHKFIFDVHSNLCLFAFSID